MILLDAGDRVIAAFTEQTLGQGRGVSGRARGDGTRGRPCHRDRCPRSDGPGRWDGRAHRHANSDLGGRCPAPSGLPRSLAQATGAQTDRAGRVQIQSDLTLPGHPEISVIGDATQVPGPGDRPLPGLATVAIQQARHVAKAIRGGAPGATEPFSYFDKGALAVVGRGKAVCEIRGHRLSGRPAFFTYLTVHMYYLTGGGPGHRLKVLIDWISARVGEPQDQVIDGELADSSGL